MENSVTPGSVVVPCFNEKDNINPFYVALNSATESLNLIGEIIFVDDGSTDGTHEAVHALTEKDHRVKCLRFSRNFGSHAAISAGLRRASGAFAIIMSVDLQDPPELIPDLVRHWRKGFHVVWATRRSREDSPAKKKLATAFYTLLRRIALPEYPREGMDFGLFDRRVLDSFKSMGELQPFVIGTILWMGFRQTTIPYDRRSRRSGVSKWSISKAVKLAIDAIVGFSGFPIRLISILGALLCAVGLLCAGIVAVQHMMSGSAAGHWNTFVAVLIVLEGFQLLMLGIVGEYVLRTAEQGKGRPQFIVMEEMGFDHKNK